MKKSKQLLFLLLLVSANVFSQGIYSLKFASQLLQSEQNVYADWVLTEIEDSIIHTNSSPLFYYYKGMLNYRFKNFSLSNEALQNIPTDFYRYDAALMMQIVNSGYLKDFGSMINTGLLISDPKNNNYKNFALASSYLLSGDFDAYNTYKLEIDTNSYLISPNFKRIDILASLKQNLKQKSPLLAGVYSAFIPGLGKVYAGDYGSGISAFFTNAALGAMLYENYRKDGIKDVKTILFASLFSVFYVGNIWGSVVNVRVHNQVLIDGINEQILLEIHIPLRNVFNTL